ncbi:uncharacterized protein [Phyllobates terribilis]|uniref:uncharacterized protein n=1 Tax=Phyllobates terribilis TaxID=111132 RepID=UPI003CCB186D
MGKTADLTDVQKAVIDTLHKEGKSQKVIAKEAGCSQSAVSKYINGRLSGRKKCGRKKCTSNQDNHSLEEIVKTRPFKNLAEIHKEWTAAGVIASRATLHRRIQDMGYPGHVKPRKTKRQRQKHLTLAKKNSLYNRPVNLQNEKLQVLGPKEEVDIHPCDSASRPYSAAGRPGSARRKCYIPTRQIPLCTVKPPAQSSNIPDDSVAPSVQPNTSEEDEMQKTSSPPSNTGRLEESGEEDERDDDAGGASIELIAEFVNALMGEDYQLAQNLSQMILLYEPNNPVAAQFSPLIEERLKIEQEQSSDDEDSEGSDEETDEHNSETDDNNNEDDEENNCTAKHIT